MKCSELASLGARQKKHALVDLYQAPQYHRTVVVLSEENRKEKGPFQGTVKKVVSIEETVKKVVTANGAKNLATPPSTSPENIVEKYVKRAKPISADEPPTPAPKKKG